MKGIIGFCIFLICVSCQNKNEQQIAPQTLKNQGIQNITLIFNKVPEMVKPNPNKPIFFPPDKMSHYFTNIGLYRDSNGIIQLLNPERSPNMDTIQISSKTKQLEIHFNQLNQEGEAFLFSAGDTAKISYKGGLVQIEILNRKTKLFDYSFNQFGYIESDSITPFELFFRRVPIRKKSQKPFPKGYYREVYLPKQTKKLEDNLYFQVKVLDSIFKRNLISKDIYLYNKNKIKYRYWSMNIKLNRLPKTFEEKAAYQDNFNDYGAITSAQQGEDFNIKELTMAGDSLLRFQYYNEFLLHHYLPQYVENIAPKSTFAYKNFGGSYRDWAVVYDSIESSKLFSEKIKSYLLYRYMDKVATDLMPKVVDTQYKKFKKRPKTEQYQSILNDEFRLTETGVNKLELVDLKNDNTNLEQLLEDNKGKVVLVDFWASWCSPCIELIPKTNRLMLDYKNDSFVYISISIDKEFNDWISSEAIKLFEGHEHNYILQNLYTSNFLKENHFRYIPRFFLFDRTGRMIDSNAPKPGTVELRKMIEKSLLGN